MATSHKLIQAGLGQLMCISLDLEECTMQNFPFQLKQHNAIKAHIFYLSIYIYIIYIYVTDLLFLTLASESGVGERRRRQSRSPAWSSSPQPLSGGSGEGMVRWPGCYR